MDLFFSFMALLPCASVLFDLDFFLICQFLPQMDSMLYIATPFMMLASFQLSQYKYLKYLFLIEWHLKHNAFDGSQRQGSSSLLKQQEYLKDKLFIKSVGVTECPYETVCNGYSVLSK